MAKIPDIDRWISEILMAEKFRDNNFGIFKDKQILGNGENIEYFERGYSTGYLSGGFGSGQGEQADFTTTTLNFFHVVTKLVVPTLYFKNPRITSRPDRRQDEASAPFAREILNHFYENQEAEFQNELAVWDSYVLNRGITKVGYATKFGMDIPDQEQKKKLTKSVVDKSLEALGLKKPSKEEPVIRPEVDKTIISEKPYIKWVSPFKFLMDPRARSLDDAMWVAEEFDKTVASLKKNKKYKNTSKLTGNRPDERTSRELLIEESSIEEFAVVRLYEIHYINDSKMYRLVMVKDGENFEELYHEESMYEMEGFQYDIWELTRHGHLQFKRSDLEKIKNLQDRFTQVIDNMLDQMERFHSKIAIDQGGMTPNGRKALEEGDVGAVVECNKNPAEVIREIALTQYKRDLKALLDDMVQLITIMTGITQAKLLGVSSGETATGETIAQGGEGIRIADMRKAVERIGNKQAEKFWAVIKQFVNLQELELITGESGVDPKTGSPKYNWLDDIDSNMSEQLTIGKYRLR